MAPAQVDSEVPCLTDAVNAWKVACPDTVQPENPSSQRQWDEPLCRLVSPVELQAVIRQHPGVLDVAVTSLPDAECGDLPVACVIPRSGADVTAEEIKDSVKEKLTDSKQLRGGVFFLKELPLTSSAKVHRQKLKEIVIARTREQVAK